MKAIAFDTETTGLDPNEDEIVTASILINENKKVEATEWLLKTSKESSEEAFEKHGISREAQIKDGEDYVSSIKDIAKELLSADIVITANGAFDITMLQKSLDKYAPDDDIDMSKVKMVDVQVIDKYTDKFRRGPRKLEDLAKHYGVSTNDSFHDSSYDAYITYQVFLKQLPKIKEFGISLDNLHIICEREYNYQKKNLAAYFKRVNKTAKVAQGYPVNTEVIEVG